MAANATPLETKVNCYDSEIELSVQIKPKFLYGNLWMMIPH